MMVLVAALVLISYVCFVTAGVLIGQGYWRY